jgi:outer membrane murein-binding lipoprotein Lpp
MSEILGTLFKYLLGLLAIVAVVVVLYEALSSNKVSTASAEVTTLQSNIAQLYGGQASMASLSNSVVVQAKAAPNSMVSGTTLLDPWSGPVTVQPDANPGQFDIILTQLPQSACNKLATAVSSYKQITINGSADTSPADPGTIATQCTSGSNNQLQFTFSG